MHIFFSGIGGTGIGPLSLIAQQVGYDVSGSDRQDSTLIQYLRNHGIENIVINQSYEAIANVHRQKTIDLYVYSSAISMEQQEWPELRFCREHQIKTSKRDELINQILNEKELQLIAVAGTHGKSTTTAMIIWLLKQLTFPISYSIGARFIDGDTSGYQCQSRYFVYETDEYDQNFLAFYPHISVITGIDWDHPDTYPTRESYTKSFRDFFQQSQHLVLWKSDLNYLNLSMNENMTLLDDEDPILNYFTLAGEVNRRNAYQAVRMIHLLTNVSLKRLSLIINRFPGLSRRFEEICLNLYTDYAHTPIKIQGALQRAHEVHGENVVVVYEGCQNLRQHFFKNDLLHLFDSCKHIYIVPTYLVREDQNLKLLNPVELRELLCSEVQMKTTPSKLDDQLKAHIQDALDHNMAVLCLTAGTKNSLDEWLRKTFSCKN